MSKWGKWGTEIFPQLWKFGTKGINKNLLQFVTPLYQGLNFLNLISSCFLRNFLQLTHPIVKTELLSILTKKMYLTSIRRGQKSCTWVKYFLTSVMVWRKKLYLTSVRIWRKQKLYLTSTRRGDQLGWTSGTFCEGMSGGGDTSYNIGETSNTEATLLNGHLAAPRNTLAVPMQIRSHESRPRRLFLAVQNSSIGDLVTDSLTH